MLSMRHYLELTLLTLSLMNSGLSQLVNSTLPQTRDIAEDDPCAVELGVASPSDNLSCIFVPMGETRCFPRDELCNGNSVCSIGSDEGANIAALDCKCITYCTDALFLTCSYL